MGMARQAHSVLVHPVAIPPANRLFRRQGRATFHVLVDLAPWEARRRRAISAGRLHNTDEVNLPEAERGIENHIPFVNRLVAWWSRMREKGWHEDATPEQRAAVKRDLEPIVAIYNEL